MVSEEPESGGGQAVEEHRLGEIAVVVVIIKYLYLCKILFPGRQNVPGKNGAQSHGFDGFVVHHAACLIVRDHKAVFAGLTVRIIKFDYLLMTGIKGCDCTDGGSL